MRKVNNDIEINITLYKILLTIYELNSMNKYPSVKGVSNILKAHEDHETNEYMSLSTYGTLISIQSRKFASYVALLEKKGYLAYKHDKKTDRLYLYITPRGIDTVIKFPKEHNFKLTQKRKNLNHEIVEIID